MSVINVTLVVEVEYVNKYVVAAQDKKGILPVATLSIALYASTKSRSSREVCNFVIGIINFNEKHQLPRAVGLAQASNALQRNEIPILGHAES